MAIQHFDKLYKVVKADKSSALLNVSTASINYASGRNFVPPALDGTPILVFTDLVSAYEFADKFPGRVVYEAEGYGEIVEVDEVLSIKQPGWERDAVAFWAAIQNHQDTSRFHTIEAKDHSVALFGVLRLHGQAQRPQKLQAAPAVGAAPRKWVGW